MNKMYSIIIILSNTFSFPLSQLNSQADPKQALFCWEILPLTACFLKVVQIHQENELGEGVCGGELVVGEMGGEERGWVGK